jgi:hypothetical protein
VRGYVDAKAEATIADERNIGRYDKNMYIFLYQDRGIYLLVPMIFVMLTCRYEIHDSEVLE